jgi:hypothetical protein
MLCQISPANLRLVHVRPGIDRIGEDSRGYVRFIQFRAGYVRSRQGRAGCQEFTG